MRRGLLTKVEAEQSVNAVDFMQHGEAMKEQIKLDMAKDVGRFLLWENVLQYTIERAPEQMAHRISCHMYALTRSIP